MGLAAMIGIVAPYLSDDWEPNPLYQLPWMLLLVAGLILHETRPYQVRLMQPIHRSASIIAAKLLLHISVGSCEHVTLFSQPISRRVADTQLSDVQNTDHVNWKGTVYPEMSRAAGAAPAAPGDKKKE